MICCLKNMSNNTKHHIEPENAVVTGNIQIWNPYKSYDPYIVAQSRSQLSSTQGNIVLTDAWEKTFASENSPNYLHLSFNNKSICNCEAIQHFRKLHKFLPSPVMFLFAKTMQGIWKCISDHKQETIIINHKPHCKRFDVPTLSSS